MAEEDWRARLGSVPGRALGPEPDPAHLPWREAAVTIEHIARGRRLGAITVGDYAKERLAFVQGHVRQVGICLSSTGQNFERFMAACLAAELAFLALAHQRERRRGGLGNPHPDSVAGPWRRAPARVEPLPVRTAAAAVAAGTPKSVSDLGGEAGRTLADC